MGNLNTCCQAKEVDRSAEVQIQKVADGTPKYRDDDLHLYNGSQNHSIEEEVMPLTGKTFRKSPQF